MVRSICASGAEETPRETIDVSDPPEAETSRTKLVGGDMADMSRLESRNCGGRRGSLGMDEEDFEGRQGKPVDIPEDAYGAAILAIVKEMAELYSGHGDFVSGIRVSFAMLLLLMNGILQWECISFISEYVVGQAVHQVQSLFADYREKVYDSDGTFNPTKWDYYPAESKGMVCQIAMSNRVFYNTILLLWTMKMINELRSCERLFNCIRQMPEPHENDERTIVKQKDDNENVRVRIIALRTRSKALLYIFVVAWKFFFAFNLLFLGLKWLSATFQFTDLVLNAVAMAFVCEIDELLYSTALPAQFQRQVQEIDFFVPTPKNSSKDLEEKAAYKRSAFYIVAAVVIVVVYGQYIQDVLPSSVTELYEQCLEQRRESIRSICDLQGWPRLAQAFYAVWTKGVGNAFSTESCYPYGEP